MRLDGYERVIYRTHTVILTDKRIVVDGNTYPLWQIESVQTARASYYFVLQAMRLVVLGLVVFALVCLLNSPMSASATLLRVSFLAAMSGMFFVLVWLAPTHVISLGSPSGSIRVMSSGDVRYLKEVAAQIDAARAQIIHR